MAPKSNYLEKLWHQHIPLKKPKQTRRTDYKMDKKKKIVPKIGIGIEKDKRKGTGIEWPSKSTSLSTPLWIKRPSLLIWRPPAVYLDWMQMTMAAPASIALQNNVIQSQNITCESCWIYEEQRRAYVDHLPILLPPRESWPFARACAFIHHNSPSSRQKIAEIFLKNVESVSN